MIKADQRNYKGRIINSFKSNQKKFYGYMRRTQTVKVQMAQLERKDCTLTETNNEAVTELCNFFKEVFIQNETCSEARQQVKGSGIFEGDMDCSARRL